MFRQANQHRYPTIFALAMDIIPVQGSAVPCERVFSSGAETDTRRRNRISHELMEALQMLKFSLKRGHGLDFTRGTGKEDEMKEMELDGQEDSRIPQDITSFIDSLLALVEEEEEHQSA